MDPLPSSAIVRFGVFEADFSAGELFKQGRRVRLQGKPFEVLRLLIESPGQLVTRERLRERLWRDAVFVDFDTNLNTAVTKLREALGDSAENPRFIETLPRRGYRFIAEVQSQAVPRDADVPLEPETAAVAAPIVAAAALPRRRWLMRVGLLAVAGCAGCLGLYAIAGRESAAHDLAPVGRERVRLAVLPFEDLGHTEEHIANGLTEELITQLGRLAPERLGVIGRASIMRFRSSPQPLRRIGDDLNVRFIVDGSIRRASDTRVRVSVRLSQVSDETVLWAEVYDRALGDGFALQIEIARAVARALAIDVLRDDVQALARATSTSSEAVDAYMRGLFELRRGKESGFLEATKHFAHATTADPRFALAHAGWAEAQLLQTRYTLQPAQSLFPDALEAARRAVALDDGLAQAHSVLGAVYQFNRQSDVAEREILRALQLNPSLAGVHEQYAWYLLENRRPHDALQPLATARDLDPLSPSVAAARGYMLSITGALAKGEEEFRRALTIDSGYPFAHYGLGHLALERGQFDDAIASFTRAYASGSRAAKYGSALAEAYVRAGRRADAARLLAELRALSAQRYVPPMYLERLSAIIERPGT